MFRHDDSLVLEKLTQVNLPSGRIYRTAAGLAYPSITRVLGAKPKPELEAWKKRVGEQEAKRIAAAAARRGTGLHTYAELHLGNEPVPTDNPYVAELWQHLRPWLNAHVTCVYKQECDLVSHKLMVAGRTDLLADVDEVFVVGDFKQSNKPKSEKYVQDYYLQGTFYALAVYEQTGRIPKEIVFPVANPDGLQIFRTRPKDNYDKLMRRIDEFYDSYSPDADAAV